MDIDQELDQIEKIAQNARAAWFGLLALLVYVGVTLMGHNDSDFFANGAATTLPIVGIDVPPASFFVAAPVLSAALYCYLHLYLLGLWEALGAIKQLQPRMTQPLSRQVFPTLFTLAGLLYRDMKRKDGCVSPRELSRMTVVTGFMLGWGFGIAILFWLWWRSMPAHEPVPTLIAGVALWMAGGVALRTILSMHRHLADTSGNAHRSSHLAWYLFAGVSLVFILSISWARCKGGFEHFIEDPWLNSDRVAHVIPLASADLREAELTSKPKDWLPYELWREDFEISFRERNGIPAGDDMPASKQMKFLLELKKRWSVKTGSLESPNLRGSDLRNARMDRAFMVGADLRGADLTGASLLYADLGGADLSHATAVNSEMSVGQFHGAILDELDWTNSNVWTADFTFSSLVSVRFVDANIRRSKFEFSDLRYAHFERTVLEKVSFNASNLSSASFIDVYDVITHNIEHAHGHISTQLPEGMKHPCHWKLHHGSDRRNQQFFFDDDETSHLEWFSSGAVIVSRNPDGSCPSEVNSTE